MQNTKTRNERQSLGLELFGEIVCKFEREESKEIDDFLVERHTKMQIKAELGMA